GGIWRIRQRPIARRSAGAGNRPRKGESPHSVGQGIAARGERLSRRPVLLPAPVCNRPLRLKTQARGAWVVARPLSSVLYENSENRRSLAEPLFCSGVEFCKAMWTTARCQ